MGAAATSMCFCEETECSRHACGSPRVQAELSDAADKEQEGYCSYLLRRLLPAMAAFYSDADFDAAGVLTGDAMAPHHMMHLLAERSTGQLEGRLADFYDRMLWVRTAVVLRACFEMMNALACFIAVLLDRCFYESLLGLVWWLASHVVAPFIALLTGVRRVAPGPSAI